MRKCRHSSRNCWLPAEIIQPPGCQGDAVTLRAGGEGEGTPEPRTPGQMDSFRRLTCGAHASAGTWLPSPSSCHSATTSPGTPVTGRGQCQVRLMARLPCMF